ncbi:hypothetical protein QQG09_01230 [Melissococcus plutonius]|uniref:Zn-finger containing protein n=1 Tax=Melissococcus plutonius TaxID=33970 RepID=A0A2Z5Y3M4_9ENTE|nr:hypothetical protein [Melissococcus plutonius]BAL62477.1 hypothetical protein MPD5_1261 [Melissococcus plutonius DAT561]MCV2499065.1 hypothetical protein [Melissococcus plutonius]MCV2500263.1 hypothetical protein [Melissococcus plutonius]MCV2504201.1 hypothetical protein [Melissococcus plutonius]MCV2507562.1 hypothetical protein [Melissococcus plutonius]
MKSNWIQRIMRGHLRLQELMRGRYGAMDALNRFLLVVALLILIIARIFSIVFISWLALLLLILLYYRFFSKQIYVRSNENKKFSTYQHTIKKIWQLNKLRLTNGKQIRYFLCPNCKQILRAPKNKGKIKVHCSACRHQFIKKV